MPFCLDHASECAQYVACASCLSLAETVERGGQRGKLGAWHVVSSDVRVAQMEPGGRRYADWPDVTRWVRDQVGQRARLVPVAAIVWRIDYEGSPG